MYLIIYHVFIFWVNFMSSVTGTGYFLDLFLKTEQLTLAVKVTNVLFIQLIGLSAQGLTSAVKVTNYLST